MENWKNNNHLKEIVLYFILLLLLIGSAFEKKEKPKIKMDDGLTIESLKEFSGFENLTNFQLEDKLHSIKSLASIIYKFVNQ